MPAEILREREVTPPPPAPTPARPGFFDLSEAIGPTRGRIEETRRRREEATTEEIAARERQAETMRPQIAETRTALAAPRIAPPPPLQLPPPPTRQLTDFLAPVAGETPQNTITKLIQGIGLLASGFTGLRQGDARAALAGLSGALKGWHEGDRERADRAFGDWHAATDRLITEHRSRHQTWRDLMDDAQITIEQKLKMLELSGLEAGYAPAIAVARRQSLDDALKFLHEDQKQLLTIQNHRDRLIEHAAEKERDREFKLALAKLTVAQKEQRQKDVLEAYDPASITALAWKAIADGGRVPSVGYGAAGQLVRGRVMKEVGRLMAENNIPLSALPGIGAEMKGWQNNINNAARNLAYWNANINTFHKHVEQFLALSEKVDRSGSPVVNRVALKVRGEYVGDASVAAYEAMAYEVAQEYAKLSVGTAQGDANTREAARLAISPAMNPQQLRAIMEQLIQAGDNRKRSWEEAMKQGADMVGTFGGRLHAPLPPAGPATPPPDFVWDPKTQRIVKRK